MWYFAALVLGAAAIYCGYAGSQHESRKSTGQIETQLQALGTEIKKLQQEPASEEQRARIEKASEEYQTLARNYFNSREYLAAKENVRTAQAEVEDLEREQFARSHLDRLVKEARQLAGAYNEAAGTEVVKVSTPGDGSEAAVPHLLLEFEGPRYWAVRIVVYSDRTRALQFVRLTPQEGEPVEYEKMLLTNDSINLVLKESKFRFSLNGRISDAVKANVAEGRPIGPQPIDQLEALSTDLLRKVIEYALLPS